MAIIVRGRSECALCADVIAPDHDVFATTAFLEDPNHELWRFSDAAMHHSCFLAWPKREEFVELFNRYYAAHYRGMRFMHPDGRIEDRDAQPRPAAFHATRAPMPQTTESQTETCTHNRHPRSP